MEEAWTVNRAVGKLSASCVKLTKSLQQAFNPRITGYFRSSPKFGGLLYHNNIVCKLKIHLCLLHTLQVLTLPGTVSADMLCFASLQITLTVPEVVGTDNRVTSNLPFLLDPSSIAKIRSKSLVTDS